MKRALLLAGVAAIFLFSSCTSIFSSKEMAGEYYALAEGFVEISKYDKAILYYKKAEQRIEYKNAAQFGLARAYALTGNWTGSYAILARLHGLDADNTLISTSYAYALVSLGKFDEALSFYASLCAKMSDDSVLARNYAELLFIAGRYEETGHQITFIKIQYPDSDGAKDIGTLEAKLAAALAPKKSTTPENLHIPGGPASSTTPTPVTAPEGSETSAQAEPAHSAP